ncbi:sensor histidine kinase [Desulfonatronum thioautotrophicum]|uniref:sensor histidine kinase n=1 Tax=Desulfonatronum thioautotrophicum TaxID=617001 RepID=UPI00069B6B70|nr:sensor histidine kinase [Desulfonatronum thioautotrophicum]
MNREVGGLDASFGSSPGASLVAPPGASPVCRPFLDADWWQGCRQVLGRWRRSLRLWLTLFFLAAALAPLALGGFLASRSLEALLREEIFQKNMILARSIASEVDDHFSDARNLLRQISSTLSQDDLIADRDVERYLEIVRTSSPLFDSITLVSEQGRVLYRAPSSEDHRGLDLSGESFFRAVLRGEDVYWSTSFMPQHATSPMTILAIPLGRVDGPKDRDVDGHARGVLVGYLDLAALGDLISGIVLPGTTYAAVMDSAGTVVGHTHRRFTEQRVNQAGLEGIREGLAGRESNFIHFHDQEHLASVAVARTQGWPVMICQPISEAFLPARTMEQILAGITVGAAILAMALGGIVAARLLRPLLLLRRKTRSIAGGDYAASPAAMPYQELEDIQEDFQLMVQAIATREQERDAVIHRLDRANADLRRFAEISAHHLQEPSRRLVSFADRLGASLAGRIDDPDSLLDLGYISANAQRLRSLLQDIQLYLAAGEPMGKIQSLDCNTLVQGAARHLGQEMEQAGATLHVGPLPTLTMDRPRLMKLLTILLENALIYRRPDVSPRIDVQGRRTERTIRLSVADNGIGIPEHYRERVFGVFERLHSGQTYPGTGTGIGLAIVRRIAESRGGRAWIEDSDLGGVAVVVEFQVDGVFESIP